MDSNARLSLSLVWLGLINTKKVEFKHNLHSVAGGMDFRAMLMRKKKPAKKVVVVSFQMYMVQFKNIKILLKIKILE